MQPNLRKAYAFWLPALRPADLERDNLDLEALVQN
jgi:hypothetical protein